MSIENSFCSINAVCIEETIICKTNKIKYLRTAAKRNVVIDVLQLL